MAVHRWRLLRHVLNVSLKKAARLRYGNATMLCALALPSATLTAQTQAIADGVRLTVVDPSGAKVPGADVRLYLAESVDHAPIKSVKTDQNGQVFIVLPAGKYTVEVRASGFSVAEQPVEVSGAPRAAVTVALRIAVASEAIGVTSDETDSEGGAGAGAISIRGRQLDVFSRDAETFQKQLNALVGTDDPPELRIDGFSGGRLPSRESIQEIRINQNAYSAQFDREGNAVVDVFTRPGTDKLHGTLYVRGNTDALNARNPFLAPQPGYYGTIYNGSLEGPLAKNTTYFLGYTRTNLQNSAAVNATIIDGSLNPSAVSQAVPNPVISDEASLRIDRQFGSHNTFTGRFNFSSGHQSNAGVGELVLASQGYLSDTKSTTLQLGNTTIAGPHVVVETRFQYRRDRASQIPVSTDTTLVVQGAFNGGGSSGQTYRDAQDNYEWQEYLSVDRGRHFLRAGARYRLTRDSNSSTSGYNGRYIFPSLTAYQITLRGIAAGLSPSQIRAAGGGPSQYSVTTGTPSAVISTGDLGLYFEDEWKVRPTFSLTSGLRYESQYGIPDHSDPAPRLGFAWQVSRPGAMAPLFRLRGGIGFFYSRFPAENILIADRQNGVSQRSYYVQNPDYLAGSVASPQTLTLSDPTIYQIAPNLRSAYVLSESITVDRRFGKYGTASATLTNERGVHLFLSRNANAPLNGVRPLGGTQNVYQYASAGTSNTRTLFTRYNAQFRDRIGLAVNYTLRFRATDAMGIDNFVSNSWDVGRDYGRTGGLARHRLAIAEWSRLPFNFATVGMLSYHSANRFNITTGQDNNGDSIFNDRPAFATDLTRPSVVRTSLGNFDTAPISGQRIIPINYGVAPGYVSAQLQLTRTVSFGPELPSAPAATLKPGQKPEPPDRKFSLNLGMTIQNIFNHVNPSTPVGQLSSPSFGRSLTLNSEQTNTTAANRVVYVFAWLTF